MKRDMQFDRDDLKDWLYRPVICFRTGWRRLKRFIAWFPIIWKDEDWDHAYLYEIIRFKIYRMRLDYTESAQRHLDWKKTIQQMKVAEELLNRLSFSDFYYDLEKNIESYEKIGKCKCPPKTFEFVPYKIDSKTNEPAAFEYVNLSCEFCKDYFPRWAKRRFSKLKLDHNYLFDHLKKYSSRWWS